MMKSRSVPQQPLVSKGTTFSLGKMKIEVLRILHKRIECRFADGSRGHLMHTDVEIALGLREE